MRVPDLPKPGDRRIYAAMIRAFRKAGATDFCSDCHAWVTTRHGEFCSWANPAYNPTQRLGTLAVVTCRVPGCTVCPGRAPLKPPTQVTPRPQEMALPAPIGPGDGSLGTGDPDTRPGGV